MSPNQSWLAKRRQGVSGVTSHDERDCVMGIRFSSLFRSDWCIRGTSTSTFHVSSHRVLSKGPFMCGWHRIGVKASHFARWQKNEIILYTSGTRYQVWYHQQDTHEDSKSELFSSFVLPDSSPLPCLPWVRRASLVYRRQHYEKKVGDEHADVSYTCDTLVESQPKPRKHNDKSKVLNSAAAASDFVFLLLQYTWYLVRTVCVSCMRSWKPVRRARSTRNTTSTHSFLRWVLTQSSIYFTASCCLLYRDTAVW